MVLSVSKQNGVVEVGLECVGACTHSCHCQMSVTDPSVQHIACKILKWWIVSQILKFFQWLRKWAAECYSCFGQCVVSKWCLDVMHSSGLTGSNFWQWCLPTSSYVSWQSLIHLGVGVPSNNDLHQNNMIMWYVDLLHIEHALSDTNLCTCHCNHVLMQIKWLYLNSLLLGSQSSTALYGSFPCIQVIHMFIYHSTVHNVYHYWRGLVRVRSHTASIVLDFLKETFGNSALRFSLFHGGSFEWDIWYYI
jgi:hypothetical protein